MTITLSVTARVAADQLPTLLQAPIESGSDLLDPVRESFEGTFVERPLRAKASDVAGALRALGMPADAKVASSHADGDAMVVLFAGRVDHRATVSDVLEALAREEEDASFTVTRDAAAGEIRVTGEISPWAHDGWLEPLLLVAMAAEKLGGKGRAAFLADEESFDECEVADRYHVEDGELVFERIYPADEGFEATRDAFAPYGVVVDE